MLSSSGRNKDSAQLIVSTLSNHCPSLYSAQNSCGNAHLQIRKTNFWKNPVVFYYFYIIKYRVKRAHVYNVPENSELISVLYDPVLIRNVARTGAVTSLHPHDPITDTSGPVLVNPFSETRQSDRPSRPTATHVCETIRSSCCRDTRNNTTSSYAIALQYTL